MNGDAVTRGASLGNAMGALAGTGSAGLACPPPIGVDAAAATGRGTPARALAATGSGAAGIWAELSTKTSGALLETGEAGATGPSSLIASSTPVTCARPATLAGTTVGDGATATAGASPATTLATLVGIFNSGLAGPRWVVGDGTVRTTGTAGLAGFAGTAAVAIRAARALSGIALGTTGGMVRIWADGSVSLVTTGTAVVATGVDVAGSWAGGAPFANSLVPVGIVETRSVCRPSLVVEGGVVRIWTGTGPIAGATVMAGTSVAGGAADPSALGLAEVPGMVKIRWAGEAWLEPEGSGTADCTAGAVADAAGAETWTAPPTLNENPRTDLGLDTTCEAPSAVTVGDWAGCDPVALARAAGSDGVAENWGAGARVTGATGTKVGNIGT
jgi:hypothetical protein